MGLLHTLAPHMKGGTGEVLSGKTNTNFRRVFSPKEENRQTTLPAPKPAVEPVSQTAREATNKVTPVEPVKPSQAIAPTTPLPDPLPTSNGTGLTTAQPTLKRQAQSRQSRTTTLQKPRGAGGLTGLESLLQSVSPPGSNNGNVLQSQTRSTEPIRLPSDSLPESSRPGDSPVSPPTATGRRRRETKSGIDPQALTPHATYLAAPLVHPAITPDAILTVTNAVRDLLQRLQSEHQWTAKTVQEWIAQHFDGRRRSQLADHELPLLLSRLQAYWQQQSGGGEPQAGTQPSS